MIEKEIQEAFRHAGDVLFLNLSSSHTSVNV